MSGQQATNATPAMPGNETSGSPMQGGSKGTASTSPLTANNNLTGASPLAAVATPSTTYSDIFSGKNTGTSPVTSFTPSLASPVTSFTPPNTPLVPAITKQAIPDTTSYYYESPGGMN